MSILRTDQPPVGTVTLWLSMFGAIWVAVSLLVFMFYLIIDFYPEEQRNMKIMGIGGGLKCGLLFILCFGLIYVTLNDASGYVAHAAPWVMMVITYSTICLFLGPWIYYCWLQQQRYKDQKDQQLHTGRYAPIPPKPAHQETVTIIYDNVLSLIDAQTTFNVKRITGTICPLYFAFMLLYIRHHNGGYIMAIFLGSLFFIAMLFQVYSSYRTMKRAVRLVQFHDEKIAPTIRIDEQGMTIPILFFNMDKKQDYFIDHEMDEVSIQWQQVTRWRLMVSCYKLDLSEKLAGSDYTSIYLRKDLMDSQKPDLLDIAAPYLSVAIERESFTH